MRCPQCQNENPAGARFCNACGSALAGACSACGQTNAQGSRFCSNCGQRLTATETAPSTRFDSPGSYTPSHLAHRILAGRKTLEGERKLVTVVFADIKGSLELIAGLDAEVSRHVLDPTIKAMICFSVTCASSPLPTVLPSRNTV